MGVVFCAREVELDRLVAVKVLSPDKRLAPLAHGRAVREALLLASLRHPNVVQVYRSGKVDDLPFLVMEWVDGGTLQDRINESPLTCREAAETVRDLAYAVAEAHALGIVHRDLKPANVLLSTPSQPGLKSVPKLADFGLARRGDGDGITETGIALGTPGYMAPEQTGLNPTTSEVGPATDIHGLGAILHACLTGKPPYEGPSSWEKLTNSARGTPASIRDSRRDAARDLATIVEKCLQAAPSRRYRSAGELADDLGRFLDGRPIIARSTAAPERALKWTRRHPALATTIALLLLAALAGSAGTAYHICSINQSLRHLAIQEEHTRDALDRATAAHKQVQANLNSFTDDVLQRMLQKGIALNEADRTLLHKIQQYYQE